jgi:hypothetical protein
MTLTRRRELLSPCHHHPTTTLARTPVARDASLVLAAGGTNHDGNRVPRQPPRAAEVDVSQRPRDKRPKGASAPAPEGEEFAVCGWRFEGRDPRRVVGEEGAADGAEKWGEGGRVEDVLLDQGVGEVPGGV